MIKKALGLGLLMVLALSALASPATSSDSFTSAASSTVLTGTGEPLFQFTPAKLQLTCKTSKYNGTFTGGAVGEITVTATYTGNATEEDGPNCSGAVVGNVSVNMNGCDYKFTGATTGVDHEYVTKFGTLTVTCPAGKEVEISWSGCTVKIPGQTPTEGGLTYTNETENGLGILKAPVVLTGLTYTSTGPICALDGVSSEANTLDLLDIFKATGYEDKCAAKECPINGDEFKVGKQVAIEVS
jgi:outer membrane lipoprotein SlyB